MERAAISRCLLKHALPNTLAAVVCLPHRVYVQLKEWCYFCYAFCNYKRSIASQSAWMRRDSALKKRSSLSRGPHAVRCRWGSVVQMLQVRHGHVLDGHWGWQELQIKVSSFFFLQPFYCCLVSQCGQICSQQHRFCWRHAFFESPGNTCASSALLATSLQLINLPSLFDLT